jgi:predicted RNA-binding protein Jag
MAEERRRQGMRRQNPSTNIKKLIGDLESKLEKSIAPEALKNLNSFERKLIHRHFDHNSLFETRTYREGDSFKLYIYPVENIKQFARNKAQEAMDSGREVALPPMGSYERYIVHSSLQDMTGIETESFGEGAERHVQITSKRFGRGLKRIAKKIKLI